MGGDCAAGDCLGRPTFCETFPGVACVRVRVYVGVCLDVSHGGALRSRPQVGRRSSGY